jgi:hypothetical protein
MTARHLPPQRFGRNNQEASANKQRTEAVTLDRRRGTANAVKVAVPESAVPLTLIEATFRRVEVPQNERLRSGHGLQPRDGIPYVDWAKPEGVAEFKHLLREILKAKDASRLVEFTIKVLGSVSFVPQEHRGTLQFAATLLRAAWKDIDDKWNAGTLKDIGAALHRTRAKGWRKGAVIKHHRIGLLAFAEISFRLSEGETRAEAVGIMQAKYGVAKSQIDTWYDSYSGKLMRAVASTSPIEAWCAYGEIPGRVDASPTIPQSNQNSSMHFLQ